MNFAIAILIRIADAVANRRPATILANAHATPSACTVEARELFGGLDAGYLPARPFGRAFSLHDAISRVVFSRTTYGYWRPWKMEEGRDNYFPIGFSGGAFGWESEPPPLPGYELYFIQGRSL